ncbi:MAG: hypothetical protein HFJ40_06545 [Clostridia bacterium]|nr:hypothetical protein [Clostridia bacterium]
MKNYINNTKIFKNIKNTNNKERKMALILIIMMTIALFLTGKSLGKEKSNFYINNNSEIAQLICVVDNSPTINITSIKNTGRYNFKVKNYNAQGEISQVDFTYNVKIVSNMDKTITLKLYKNGQEINTKDNKTENIVLTKNEKQEDNYELEIIYDKTKSDSIGDIIQDIQLEVCAEQLNG